MSWICKNCGTKNDDFSDICDVCGYPCEGRLTEADGDYTVSERYEASYESSSYTFVNDNPPQAGSSLFESRKKKFLKIIAIALPILFFVVGQIILYVTFGTMGKVFLVTKIAKKIGWYWINSLPCYIVMSVICAGLCGITICNTYRFADNDSEFSVYFSLLPYCIMMLFLPSLSSVWLLIFEIIMLDDSSERGFLITINVIAAICFILAPILSVGLGVTYTINFDQQGGSGGTVRAEATFEDLMPDATAPQRDGYVFDGYYSSRTGGVQYYDSSMVCTRLWDTKKAVTLYAHWKLATYTVYLEPQGGKGGTLSVEVTYTRSMPSATAPTRTGYEFNGYFDAAEDGVQYYDKDMNSCRKWETTNDATLYAQWEAKRYLVTLDLQGGTGTSHIAVTYGQEMPPLEKPTKDGFAFMGYYEAADGFGLMYYDSEMRSVREWARDEGGTLFAYWSSGLAASVESAYLNDISDSKSTTVNVLNGSGKYTYRTSSDSYPGVTVTLSDNTVTLTKTADGCSGIVDIIVTDTVTGAEATCSISYTTTAPPPQQSEDPPGCVAPDTLITLADGTQKAVEELTGDESILVWNFYTGCYESLPLLFIEKTEQQELPVVDLYFSDGTHTKTVGQHCYWSFDEGRFVVINRSSANSYVGQWFGKSDFPSDLGYKKVQLIRVETYTENIGSYNPVAYGNLAFFADGILSAPSMAGAFINMFDVNDQTLRYDEVKMGQDIEQYGLYTYADFAQYVPNAYLQFIPEAYFTAFHLEYLKISIEKGIDTWESLASYFEVLSGILGGAI